MNKRLNILVANDDGIASPGLLRLANAAARLGDVWVAAPAGQCSGMSQKITIAGEISVEKRNFPADVKAAYAIGGTPADCVKTAIKSLLPVKPDVVFSGINIGYNSFTYGAQILRQKQKELSFAVPWVVKLRLDSRIPDTYDSSFFASVVRTGLTYGIYSYQLRSMDHHEDMESYLAVIQSHPECAFLWFLSDTPLTEKQQKLLLSCPNLMVSLPIDAPSTASMAKALRRQKTLFGMHKVYQDADAAAYLLSFDHLYSQMEQSVFFFLVADDSCSKESIRAVSDVVQQYHFTPIQPFFPIEVQEDSRKIEQIITANPAYLLLLPDHMARTLDTPTVSFEELSLRNIFYRELLADA